MQLGVALSFGAIKSNLNIEFSEPSSAGSQFIILVFLSSVNSWLWWTWQCFFCFLFFSWYLKVKTLKWVARWQLTKNQNSSCLSWSSRQTNSSWFKRNKHWWTDGAHRWQMKLQGWAVCWKHLNLGYFRSLVKTLPTLFCDRLNVSCSADDSVDLHVYINWLRRWRPVDESLQGRAGYIIYIHTVCTQLSWKH